MTVQAHLTELTEKHRQLKQAIEEEMQHTSYDTLRLAELKRKKLKLKDEIARLQTQQH